MTPFTYLAAIKFSSFQFCEFKLVGPISAKIKQNSACFYAGGGSQQTLRFEVYMENV